MKPNQTCERVAPIPFWLVLVCSALAIFFIHLAMERQPTLPDRVAFEEIEEKRPIVEQISEQPLQSIQSSSHFGGDDKARELGAWLSGAKFKGSSDRVSYSKEYEASAHGGDVHFDYRFASEEAGPSMSRLRLVGSSAESPESNNVGRAEDWQSFQFGLNFKIEATTSGEVDRKTSPGAETEPEGKTFW